MASAAALDTIQHRGEFEYPIQVWYFNLSVLAVGLATNTVFSIWAKIAPQFRGGHNSAAREAASIRRLPAALLTAWRIVAFRWRFPLGGTTGVSIFEVFVVLIYIAALLIWEFVHTDNLNPDFWSNKAAHIMAAQLNILPALSAKNNIIGYIIGVSYEKLNFMHRAFGRYLYVFVWIHVWGRWLAWDHLTGDGYILAFAWQQVGAVAGVAYTIAIILSLRPIRRWSYEIFYYTHCVIIFIFVIAACIHTSTPGFAYYVWPIWVIWGFERIVRSLRYLILNIFCLPRTGAPSTAELVLITPNTVRVTLLRRMPLGWRAGQHAFLNFPSVSATCFESHPFSIASIPGRPSDDSDCEADELVFYVKARKGATRRIVDLAKRKPGVRVQANIDGPYGRPTDLRPYRTCLLIAGGTGISYTLPLFLDTIKHASNLSSTRISRVHFVWAMRSRAFASGLAPILSRALASCPASLDVQLSIYITGTDEIEYEKNSRDLLEAGIPATSTAAYSAANVSSTRRPSSQEDAAEMDVAIPTKQGRPDFRAIVREEIARGVGPLAIEVSGPHPLVSDVRAEVSHLVPGIQDVLRGGPTIHFHAETFAY